MNEELETPVEKEPSEYDASAASESPDALKKRLSDAESSLNEAIRRRTIADEDVRLAEENSRIASDQYIRTLEASIVEHRLRESSPLARAVPDEDLLEIDIRVILKRLDALDERIRLSAEREMRNLGIRAVGPLLRVMRNEAVRRDRWSMVVAGISVFAIVLSLLGMSTRLSNGSEPLYVLLLIVLVSMISTIRPTKMQRRAARELAKYDDARVIGPLAEGLELDDPFTRGVAASGLKRLLPRVRASDAESITKTHLATLYRSLSSEDLNLVIAILRALEQIGDEDALPYVEKLTARPALSETERKVRAAANECVPALRARLGRDGQISTLLRAAQSPDSMDQSLLRPLSQGVSPNSDALLRPITISESES